MKNHVKLQKYLIILLLTMCTTVAFAQFTRQQAIDEVLNEIVVADTGNINVYSAYTLKSYNDSINLVFDTTLLCPYNYNWVFFVDDHPMAGWTHQCRYIFMDSITGNYQIADADQYPACFDNIGCSEYEVVSQVYSYPVATLPPNQNGTYYTTTTNDNLYAVLIVTQDAYQYPGNMPNRFWYDVSVVYNTLIQVYGYSKDNIYVHYYDGTSPRSPEDLDDPQDPSYDIDYPASKTRILETFENLAGISTSNPSIAPLDEDDQLFVYFDGHGDNNYNQSAILCKQPGCQYEYLYDDELADAVEGIDCAHMIFLFQPCHSGNFAYELTDYNSYDVACENRVVHTSTSLDLGSVAELNLTDGIYTEYTFYWTAAARGHYPVYLSPWVESYETGSFPFDVLYPFGDHPADYDPDLNNDGFVQMEEAFLYADDMDAWSPNGYHHPDPIYWEYYEEPQNENTMGCQNTYDYYDNLTTLYGLAGTVDDYTEIIGNRNYLVGNTLTVDYDLDIYDNANIYISGENARVDVVDGDLNTHTNVSFYGSEINVYDDFFMGQQNTFNNCNITVEGDIEIGQQATFNDMELYLNDHNLQTTFNGSVFNNSVLHNYGKGLTMDNSTFNDCYEANSHLGDVTITNTTFNRTQLFLMNHRDYVNYMASVSNCSFNFNSINTITAIMMLNYQRFLIQNNTIDEYFHGIELLLCGEGVSGNQTILENEITNCTGAGILSYGSTSSIARNNIHDNYHGILLYNNCNTDLVGNPNATTYAETQQIRDNDIYEVYASTGSFPWYMRHNVIIDEDNWGNPNDPMIYYSGPASTPLCVQYNCWGNNFNSLDDLYPIDEYFYEPI